MATGNLTSKTLIETVKREGMIPTSQLTFKDSDFLAMANQEIRIGMLPSVMQFHEEFYVRDCAPIKILPNQSAYPIPYRAVGGKFRELFFLDEQNQLRSMSRIDPDLRAYYQQTNFQNRFIYYYLQGNEIVLAPDVESNPVGSLVFSFYMRPNELVDASRVATITDINIVGTDTVFTVDQIPNNVTPIVQSGVAVTGFSTSSKLDLLQTNPGFKTISFDVVPTAIDSVNKTITFTTDDLDGGTIAGDYLAFAGECVIPQVPADLHDMLAQRVVLRCLQALGDAQGYGVAQSKLEEMQKYTGFLIDNRSEGNARKINNIRSTLRNAKVSRRWW